MAQPYPLPPLTSQFSTVMMLRKEEKKQRLRKEKGREKKKKEKGGERNYNCLKSRE
jgi:hypothetical protein